MLLGIYLMGSVGDAYCRELSREALAGVLPVYKGNNTFKETSSSGEHTRFVPSAQNTRVRILAEEYSYSGIYASAVRQVFHTLELKADKSMYPTATLAALAPARDQIKQVPSINAYPNPSHGITLFSLNQTASDNYKIRISNTIGRVVTSTELASANANTVVQLDMSSLPAGVYFYSLLVNDKTVETKRLILQK